MARVAGLIPVPAMDTVTPWAGINTALWRRLAGAPADDGASGPVFHLDPYTLWALQTGLRSLNYQPPRPSAAGGQPPPPPALLPVLPPALSFVMVHDPAQLPPTWPMPGVSVPPQYSRPLPNSQTPRHVTLRLATEGLSLDQLQQKVAELVQTRGILRVQMGSQRPVAPPPLPDGTPPAQQADDTDIQPLTPPATLVLGALEDGCPFAHAALRDGAGTRVAALWDQSLARQSEWPWQTLPQQGYGLQLSGCAMQMLITRHSSPEGLDEERLYTDPQVDMPHLTGRRSHAAAVLGLLAGHRLALPHPPWPTAAQGAPLPAEDGPSHPADPPVDEASSLPLVVVQLPREQVKVTSGRWLAVNALDGLHYLINTARRLGDSSNPPVLVVNMSYGGNAGSHDGTGLIEGAMAELCAADQRLALVLAAGNSHGTRATTDEGGPGSLPGGVHGVQTLAPHGIAHFSLLVPPDKQFETYLELWFSLVHSPDHADHTNTNSSDSGSGSDTDTAPAIVAHWLRPGEVRVQLTAPNGQVLQAGFPDMVFSHPIPKEAVAGLVCLPKVSQSQHRSMALLVIAATQNSSRYVEAPAGRWEIAIHHTGSTQRRLQVDAWVERDDTTVGAVRSQAARLVAPPDDQPSPLTDANTLSHRRLHPRMVTVGALLNQAENSGWPSVSPYSAEGLDAHSGPSHSALVDSGIAEPGMAVLGSQSGLQGRADGTSLAAPQVARWLANQVAHGHSLSDVLAETDTDQNARRGHFVP